MTIGRAVGGRDELWAKLGVNAEITAVGTVVNQQTSPRNRVSKICRRVCQSAREVRHSDRARAHAYREQPPLTAAWASSRLALRPWDQSFASAEFRQTFSHPWRPTTKANPDSVMEFNLPVRATRTPTSRNDEFQNPNEYLLLPSNLSHPTVGKSAEDPRI